MVAKGLQTLTAICAGVLLFCFWPSLMHNVSRVYEALFLDAHYEYIGLFDKEYQKELSWKQKIICLNDYADSAMLDFLQSIETAPGKKVLHDHRGKLTEKFSFSGRHFVVKSATRDGFFRNLLAMSMGVNVWNNIHWAQKMGVPVMKPVALVEKRKWNQTTSFVVYLFEGKVCENEFKEREGFFPKIQELKELLSQKHVIHHDFRLRNIVLLDDGSLQFIDIDKLHWYKTSSHVFKQRLKREVKKFNLNLVEQSTSTKRLNS